MQKNVPEKLITTPEHSAPTVALPMVEGPEGLKNLYERLRTDEHLSFSPTEAADNTWWRQLGNRLFSVYEIPTDIAYNLQLAAAHNVDFSYRGKPTGQGFSVFELGGLEEDRRAVGVVIETLELIDQWSGGLLAARPDRQKIVLSQGPRIYSTQHKDSSGKPKENLGLSFRGVTLISMPYLKELAAQHQDVNFYNLLATQITHEVLGHKTEMAIEGENGVGEYFPRFFDYSKPGKGELYASIYTSITPKDAGVTSAGPVREYGYTGPGEDLATSVEEAVAAAMGWDVTNRMHPRFRNKLDRYRDDLAMQFLGTAALRAKKEGHEGVPGLVGSELYYDAGGRPQSARTMQTTTTYGQEALDQELRRIALAGS